MLFLIERLFLKQKLSRLSSIGFKKKKGNQGNLLSPVHQFAIVQYIP